MAGTSTEVKRLEEYIDQSDWRVKANANQGYSVGGAILNVAGGAAAGFWFKQYGEEIANLHKDGDFYIHDLDYVSGYCCGHSLRSLLLEGFNGVEGKISSNPPKHLSSALNQMVNFLGTLQNEWAGAQAFSSVDTLLAPYVWIEREDIRKEMQNLGADVDNDDAKQKIEEALTKRVHQLFQELIFNLSVSSRWGNQTVFSNFSFDIKPPKDLADKNPIVGGEPMNMVYADFQKEMDLINITFCDVMYEGDRDGRIFSFPIPTYSMTKDFPYYSDVGDAIFKLTAKYGSPYFANYTNTTMSPEDARSMCPLTGDTKVLVRSSRGTMTMTIHDMYRNWLCGKVKNYYVWDGGSWCKAIPNCQGKQSFLIITLGNGDIVKMGKHHLQYLPEKNASIEAKDLQIGDYIPFNSKQTNDDVALGSFEAGVVIGAFAGDGSFDRDGVIYSLSSEPKDDETEKYIREFFETLGFGVSKFVQGGLRTIRCGNGSKSYITRFIEGTALTKKFKSIVFKQSSDFLRGILYGFKLTDGSRDRNRLYSASEMLMDDLKIITNILGKKHSLVNADERPNRLGTNPVYRLDIPDRASYGELFKTIGGYNCYPITDIREVDEEQTLYCMEVQNDNHLFTLANGILTHNCRLRLDLRELKRRGGGLFGSSEQTGSIGVVTLNMARIGALYKTKEEMYKRIDYLMDMAKTSLLIKRKVITDLLERGFYPYTKRYLGSFNNFFNTIGVNGMNEMVENMTDKKENITTEFGQAFCEETLKHINDRLLKYQQESGSLWNMEGTPAEGATYKLAMSDKKKYGSEYVYYTNSSQLPTGFTDDPFLAIKMQENLQSLYTGGTVLHLYLSRALGNTETQSRDLTRELIRRAMIHSKLPYVSATPVFSVCPEHGYIYGENPVCPKCGKKTEVWSRVMGYYRPRDSYNIGKRYEHDHKKLFDAELTQKELEVEKDEIVPMKTVDGQFIDKHAA